MTTVDYYGKYKNSLQGNSMNSFVSTNKETVISNFDQSLFSESILVNSIDEYQVIFKQEKKSEDKKLIFKPDVKIDIGSVVELKSKSYLVMDFLGEGINEIYPAATLRFCNSIYPIKSGKTSVIIGYDRYGKPIKKDVWAVDKSVPCIAEVSTTTTNTDTQLVIPDNKMYITIQYQESDTFAVNYEFNMYNSNYKITEIDYTKVINDKGIIKIIAERV